MRLTLPLSLALCLQYLHAKLCRPSEDRGSLFWQRCSPGVVPGCPAAAAAGCNASSWALPHDPLHPEYPLTADEVAKYRRRCLLAQLEHASLRQLAQRAPQLLLAPIGASSISGHQLLDRMGLLVAEQLEQPAAPSSGGGGSSPDHLAAVLLDAWTAAYCASQGGSNGGDSAAVAAVAAHVLGIAHRHAGLHGPLLSSLRHLVRGEPGSAGALPPEHLQLQTAVTLATVAGALVQREEQAASSRDPAALQPLFVWQQPGRSGDCESAAAAALPGPLWLQQLLLELPLGSAAALVHANNVAAAYLSSLRHFRQYCLLPERCSSQHLPAAHWRQPAAVPAGGYAGEYASRLVFPASTATLRLMQWVLLRLSVARRVLPACILETGGGGEDDRPAKRHCTGAGGTAAAEDAVAVLQLCSASLGSAAVAPLASAAGDHRQCRAQGSAHCCASHVCSRAAVACLHDLIATPAPLLLCRSAPPG